VLKSPSVDHENIVTTLLYPNFHVIKSNSDHIENDTVIARSALLASACLFLKYTKNPTIKEIIAVGMWE